jgi:hypothetical protein
MQVVQLFLSLFALMLFVFTNRKRLPQVIHMLRIENQTLRHTLAQYNIRVQFQPYGKFSIATLFENTERAERFFSLVSPTTILTAFYSGSSISLHFDFLYFCVR